MPRAWSGGYIIRYPDALNSKIELVPAACSWDAKPPVLPDDNGFYPVAMPGRTVAV